ncbi:hypothetical protein BC835DRAFT_1330192 [Cytidiella melzeri]|nr:hypothetical protein BC835DRAFT_1330192 [Cytidiella melzeri]
MIWSYVSRLITVDLCLPLSLSIAPTVPTLCLVQVDSFPLHERQQRHNSATEFSSHELFESPRARWHTRMSSYSAASAITEKLLSLLR